VAERLPDLPLDVRITGRDNRFDLVSLMLPSVEFLAGDFFADFRLSGTPNKPHLEGTAFIKDARLKYYDLADTLKADSAGVRFQDNRIIIDGIRAYVYDRKHKRPRYADIGGQIEVQSLDVLDYDVDVTVGEEFPFRYELADLEGVVEGDVRITGSNPPSVEGDLTLLSGRDRSEFSEEASQMNLPLIYSVAGETTWDVDLKIDILSNYWVKNQDIDAEFSGFLNIIRENDRYRYAGEIEILRGKGYLFDKTFRIKSDSRIVFEDIELPDPRLDIWATTRIPVPRAEGEERAYEDIDVHVTGTLENPLFGFFVAGYTDSAMSEEAVLPLLVANYYGSETGVGAFQERLSQLISSQVSQISSRQLGVETFEIDPTYEGNLDLARTKVTLGMYTAPNLYLYGSSDIALESRQEVGFEYRIKKWFLLEGKRDEDELYHLNLKLHKEFAW